MELTTFPSDRYYIKAQRRQRKRKSDLPAYTDREISAIARYQSGLISRDSPKVLLGICHGARGGREADRLLAYLPGNVEMVSTDLFPELGKVIEWDFSQPKEGWKDHFHFVYSNSLDHARHPMDTLRVWFSQLIKSEVGRLYIQWTTCHKGVHGGDCFGATLDEYISLIDEAGEVVDLLYCGDGLTVIVAKRRDL